MKNGVVGVVGMGGFEREENKKEKNVFKERVFLSFSPFSLFCCFFVFPRRVCVCVFFCVVLLSEVCVMLLCV